MSHSSRDTQLSTPALWCVQIFAGSSILDVRPESRNKKPSILNLKFANLACATQWSYLADHYNHPQLCTLVCYSIASSILEWCCGLCNHLRVALPMYNIGWSKRLTPHNDYYGSGSIPLVGSSFGNELFVHTHDTNTIIWLFTTKWPTRAGFRQISYGLRAQVENTRNRSNKLGNA